MDNLSLSFQITLIGMGLVVGAIILLWIVMSVLVRLTPDHTAAEEPTAAPVEPPTANRERKQRAASAAIAIAIAHEVTPKIHEFPEPPPAILSAWQAVQRSRLLGQRGPRQK